MKIKATILLLLLVLASLTLQRCAMSATSLGNASQTEYEELPTNHKKKDKLSYLFPEAKLVSPTNATLTKTGITITCEIEPINVTFQNEYTEKPVAAKPDQKGKFSYDNYEMKTTQTVTLNPERLIFNLNIRNNSGQILRLHEIGLALLVDGENYVLDQKNDVKGWENGMILNGFSKSYAIWGPTIKSIGDSKLFAIVLQGVPTRYDEAGVVSKREAFEWTYSLTLQQKSEEIEVSYEYQTRPVRAERCSPCRGVGSTTERTKCSKCNGYGAYIGGDGRKYTCPTVGLLGTKYCGGTGYIDMQYTCKNCSGTGQITYPVSPRARITSQQNYYGYQLKIVTIPAGGTVQVYDQLIKDYVEVNPGIVKWWNQTDRSKKPIKVTQNGKTISLFPYNKNGNVAAVVKVDFSKSEVIVKNGQIIE